MYPDKVWITAQPEIIQQVCGPWAEQRIGHIPPFEKFTGIAIFRADLLLGCVLYTDFTGRSICMHVASNGSRHWATPKFLRMVFEYPFNELNVRRVTALVVESNSDAMKLDQHLGFRIEGRLREAAWDGGDVVVLGMLRRECRFLKERNELRRQRLRAISA
jgi:RimJ/RimL family protein N-acetyltransferase